MLPFRSGRTCSCSVRFPLFFLLTLSLAALAQEPKTGQTQSSPPGAGVIAERASSFNIPLAIGQEAKGLVLPNIDMEGRMRGRVEAVSAKRIDEEQIQFSGLKWTTFTPENKPNLRIEMKECVLSLKTRVISSQHQTSVARGDFQIVGDTMRFDSAAGTGTLVGNVKMVISNQAFLAPKKAE